MHPFIKTYSISLFLLITPLLFGQRQMEGLDRGLIALKTENGFFLGWRSLATDPENLGFNLYRQNGDGKPVLINTVPLDGPTHFLDSIAPMDEPTNWYLKAVRKGKELERTKEFALMANSANKDYISIPLKLAKGYIANDVSVGDLNGDGRYELVVHLTGRSKDTASKGMTDPPVFQAYDLKGNLLWEINLGINIREGAHYTQFIVYDLDGDGIAEMVCKTADGTIDAKKNVVGDPQMDWRDKDPKSETYGKILDGPEYLTVFNGQTGEIISTTDYIPERGDLGGWGGIGGNGKNDQTGNRADRFTACVAYLDGIHPSVVMERGYYGRTVLVAYDLKDGELVCRWVFDSVDGKNPYSGMGNHNLSVADVDADGKDEIIFGAMCVDDDGKGLYTTGLRHGDALHVGDLDPDRQGLEVFGIHEVEEGTKGPGVALFDAATGEILFRDAQDQDVGRGVADNIVPTHKGAQMWWTGSPYLWDINGKRVGNSPPSHNFLIYWDGDSSRELLNSNYIDKYGTGRLFTANGATSNNGTKATPALSADILGDWREELILRSEDNKELRIYSTTVPTKIRQYTLMHDPQYRLSVAWQNVGYNQPPHLGFYMGAGMGPAPLPSIFLVPKFNTE